MKTTWILIAHRAGARLFEHRGREGGIVLLEDFPHPEGRLKNGEINADKPGRSLDSMRTGGRHAMAKEHLPTEVVAQRFAKELAGHLDHGRSQNRYERLVLVAEPRFLGTLRGALGAPTAALVDATVDKDLGGVESRDLPRYLGEVVAL